MKGRLKGTGSGGGFDGEGPWKGHIEEMRAMVQEEAPSPKWSSGRIGMDMP